jgi:hypothetical protein
MTSSTDLITRGWFGFLVVWLIGLDFLHPALPVAVGVVLLLILGWLLHLSSGKIKASLLVTSSQLQDPPDTPSAPGNRPLSAGRGLVEQPPPSCSPPSVSDVVGEIALEGDSDSDNDSNSSDSEFKAFLCRLAAGEEDLWSDDEEEAEIAHSDSSGGESRSDDSKESDESSGSGLVVSWWTTEECFDTSIRQHIQRHQQMG